MTRTNDIFTTILFASLLILPCAAQQNEDRNDHKDFSSPAKPVPSVDVGSGPYMADLQRRIKRAWFPPKGEESKKVVVGFKVSRTGQLSRLRLCTSSGSTLADQAALKAVENAAPFHNLPEGANDTNDIYFSFDHDVFTGGGGGAFRRF